MNEITDALFEDYVKRHEGMLRSFANRISSVYLTPDDYYSIMLGVLLECMKTYDVTKNTKFSSYLYNSLNLRMMTEFKKVQKDLRLVRESAEIMNDGDLEDVMNEVPSDALTPDQLAYAEDIKDYLLGLPHGAMSYDIIVNGVSYSDIARATGVSHTTIMRRHEITLNELQNFFKI